MPLICMCRAGYTWLPAAAIRAIVSLIAAEVLTNGGHVKPALLHLESGEAAVQV